MDVKNGVIAKIGEYEKMGDIENWGKLAVNEDEVVLKIVKKIVIIVKNIENCKK